MITIEEAISLLREGKAQLTGEDNYMTEGELIILLEELDRYRQAEKQRKPHNFFINSYSKQSIIDMEDNNLNKVLYHLCRQNVSIMDGWYPIPSTFLSEICNLSLYKTRKELKKLKEQGYIISDCMSIYNDFECQQYIIRGYTLTEKGKETEEYRKAYEEERKLCDECFGFDIGETK